MYISTTVLLGLLGAYQTVALLNELGINNEPSVLCAGDESELHCQSFLQSGSNSASSALTEYCSQGPFVLYLQQIC